MSGVKSPDVRNYTIGKGIALFKKDGTSDFVALGNCPKMVYTPQVTVLPHFSAMAGTKVQDFSVITQKGGQIQVDMEEMTANNLALFFLGQVNATDPDNVTVGIFDELEQIRGEMAFYATNDVGPRWYFDFTRVLISPQGNFNPISDGYNAMTVTMTHVIDDNGLFGTMTLKPDVSTIAPENILTPFVTGALHQGDDPAFAQTGEQMTVNKGAWIGAQRYAFQWFQDGTDEISGATSPTYTPVVADEGSTLTCRVTASNGVGSTAAMSSATMAVHA